MPAPIYLFYYVLIGSLIATFTILLGLRKALRDAAWPEHDRTVTSRVSAFILIGWLVLCVALGLAGVYRAGPNRIPTLQFGIVVPILLGAWLIWRSPAVGRMINAVPQPWIIAVQLYRVLGAIFLVLYATGKIPGLFAWPAGVGDIIVGLLAPVLAVAYARDPHRNAKLVTAWNVFGILDLIVAVTTGFITSPSPILSYEPPNELISVFPVVLIPIYLVPLAILLHLTSLAKLHGKLAHPRKIAIESAVRS